MPKFELRDERDSGYFTIDNEVIDDLAAKIGVYALAVYNALCRFANQAVAYPSLETIGEKLKISRSSVKKALAALDKAKMIHIQHRPGDPANHVAPQSSIYSILKLKTGGGRLPHGLPHDTTGVGYVATGGRLPHDRGVGYLATPNNPSINNPNLTNTAEANGGGARARNGSPDRDQQWLVKRLVAEASLRPAQALSAVERGVVKTDADVDRCVQFVLSSDAEKPAAVLWSQWLKLGELPSSPPPPRTPGQALDELPQAEILRQFEEMDANYSKRGK